jgi:hypothetical protein
VSAISDAWPADRRARLLVAVCLIVGSVYFAKALYRGASFTQGDFYFSLPGEYAQRLNPTLWNSPDLKGAIAFNHGAYMYGPTQYLTLFPIVFLDSYRSIARVLLVAYAGVLVIGYRRLWRLLAADAAHAPVLAAAVFAIVFAFLPLTTALVQREFEVVAFVALVMACACMVSGRDVAGGALIAYLTWFKYWPIMLLGTFILHRRLKGLTAFAVTSVALLLAAQLAFGLNHFIIAKTVSIVEGLVRPLGSGEVLYPVIARGALKSDFCRQWVGGRGTLADVRWALCGVEDHWPWLSAKVAFATLTITTGALYVWGALTLERASADAERAKWGAIWEFSILTMAGVAFVHAHYYYFVVFLLPLTALLYWYATRPQPWRSVKLGVWASTYMLLNALMIPTTWLSVLLQTDAWQAYLESGLCLLGMLMLLGLVLWEFGQLARRAPVARTAAC